MTFITPCCVFKKKILMHIKFILVRKLHHKPPGIVKGFGRALGKAVATARTPNSIMASVSFMVLYLLSWSCVTLCLTKDHNRSWHPTDFDNFKFPCLTPTVTKHLDVSFCSYLQPIYTTVKVRLIPVQYGVYLSFMEIVEYSLYFNKFGGTLNPCTIYGVYLCFREICRVQLVLQHGQRNCMRLIHVQHGVYLSFMEIEEYCLCFSKVTQTIQCHFHVYPFTSTLMATVVLRRWNVYYSG